ncbi:MAG: ABC transporter substrate-binding protein [Sphaerochaetaceae bacterium]
MKKVIVVILLLAVAFATFAAGNAEKPASVAVDASTPVKGGRMIISAATPTTRAWYDIRGIMAVAMFGTIYEPLARYGSDGAPVPFLAESIIPDSKSLTWTIKIRDGIKFSDGSDLNAEVVKWNLDYYAQKGVLRSSFFKYFNNAEVIDNLTVVCHFKQWDSLFDYSLCRTVLIASKKAFDEKGLDWLVGNPVGTGPFVQREFNADVSWILDRNPNYWQGEVNLDGLDMVYYQQELVAATSLNAGKVDALVTENYSMVEQLKAYKGLTSKAADLPSYYYTLCFNMRGDDPFTNPLVRKAVSHAIDVDSILDTLTFGYAMKTNQWAPESSPFFNKDVKGQEFDVAKAKALLAEAGYPNGFSTMITCGSQTLVVNTAQIIKEQLSKIGINAEIRPIEGAAFVNYIGGWEKGMFLHMMGAEAGAASQYSTTFYQYTGFGLGVNAFVIPDYLDAVTTKITSAPSEEERNAKTQQVAKIAVDDECMIKVLYGSRSIAYVGDRIKDHHFNDVQNLRFDVWEAWKSTK